MNYAVRMAKSILAEHEQRQADFFKMYEKIYKAWEKSNKIGYVYLQRNRSDEGEIWYSIDIYAPECNDVYKHETIYESDYDGSNEAKAQQVINYWKGKTNTLCYSENSILKPNEK